MHRRTPSWHFGVPARPRTKARAGWPYRFRGSQAPNPRASAQVGRLFPRVGRLRDDSFPERQTRRGRRHKRRQSKERR